MIQDWTSLVVGSLQNLWVGTISALGNIVGALIILLIGLIVAAGLGSLVERLIGLLKLDKGLVSLGVKEYFDRAGVNLNTGKFFGKLVYWFLVVVFLLAVSDILGFYSLSGFLREALLYIPNVVGAERAPPCGELFGFAHVVGGGGLRVPRGALPARGGGRDRECPGHRFRGDARHRRRHCVRIGRQGLRLIAHCALEGACGVSASHQALGVSSEPRSDSSRSGILFEQIQEKIRGCYS